MPLAVLAFLLYSFLQSEIPYKPSEEFHLVIDYKFKQRTMGTSATLDFGETVGEHEKKMRGSGPLPYLIIELKILKLAEGEVKVKAVTGNGKIVFNRKAEVGVIHKLDLGFTDDVKDRVTPYEFNIYFLSSSKKILSRIHLFVEEEGVVLVNNEQRGKF